MKNTKKSKISRIVLTFLCVFTFVIAFNISTSSSKAANEIDKNGNICWLCGTDDLQNYKEWQFIQKIKDIKSVFGNQINEPALMSTVMHKSSAFQTISDQYDKTYDSDEFKKSFQALNKLTADTSMKAEKNAQIDLLTAATIVMLDSSGFGKPYDAKKYQEALAKNQLVGNADAGGYFANAAFCTFGAIGDTILTPFQFLFAPFVGDNVADVAINKATRYANMTSICENGYIGGLYENVKETKDSEQKQAKKDQIAKEIIQNVDAYKEIFGLKEDKCLYNSSSYTGDAVNWRQAGAPWSSLTLGPGGDSVANSGCTSTSMAYLIQKSGTKLTVDNFDPGVFVQNAKYTGSALYWNTWSGIAPNFVMDQQNLVLNGGDPAVIFSNLVNEPTADGYQRFIIIEVPGHWVAFDHVENGVVYVMDPAAPAGVGLIPLTDVTNQRGGVLHYNTFYASDVPFGSSGSSNGISSNFPSTGGASSGSSSYDECATTGTGEIIIPEEFGNGGYTITEYDRFNWGWDQGKVFRKWQDAGSIFTEGIATIDNRFLIACTETFGKVGDKVDFFLADGTKIPAIIGDVKSSGDEGYNKWGHNNGQNVLEFEVASVYYHQYGNPGSGNGWYDQWHGKRVASATNLGSML